MKKVETSANKNNEQIEELLALYQQKALEVVELKEILEELQGKLQEAQTTMSNIKYCIEYLNH